MTYKTCIANVMATRFMMLNYPETLQMTQEETCQFFADKDANKDENDLTVINEFSHFVKSRFLDVSPSDQLMAMNFLFGYNGEFLAINNKTTFNLYSYANAKEMVTSLKNYNKTPKSSTIASYIVDNKVGLLSMTSMSRYIGDCAKKITMTPDTDAKKIILSFDGSSDSKTIRNHKAKPRNIANAIENSKTQLSIIKKEEIEEAVSKLDSYYGDYCISKLSDRHTPKSIVGNIPAYAMIYKTLDTLEKYSVNDLKVIGQKAFEDNTGRSINSKKFNQVIDKMNNNILSRSIMVIDSNLSNEINGSQRHLYSV